MTYLNFHQAMFNHYLNRIHSFTKNYQRALEKDPEGIHDVRVDLKRMRALFNLVGCIQKKFPSKEEFASLKMIANNTSDIRDIQVQRKLLEIMKKKVHVSVKVYESFLATKENKYQETFDIFTQKKNRLAHLEKAQKSIETSLRGVLKDEARKKAKGHFISLINKVIILHDNHNLKAKKLHKIRILCKEIQYAFEIMRECLQMFQKGDTFLEEVKRVNRILGQLHDFDISLGYLDDFLTYHSKRVMQKQYQKLIRHIHREKEEQKKIFSTLWNYLVTIAQSL